MSRVFKWNMFFTSFLPLWASIIVSDIWTVISEGYKFVKGLNTVPVSINGFVHEVFRFLGNVPIQLVSILILLLHISVSTHYITKEIKLQESSSNREEGCILRAKRANKLTAEFLLAYILPMIAFDFGSLDSIALFLIYFVVLSFLCVRNSNVYTNIFLEFKGYKMYECDIECGVMNKKYIYTDCVVISKNNLTQPLPRKIQYFDFENYIYIDIGGTNE